MNFTGIQPLLAEFLQRGMAISPWLMINSQARFDVDLYTQIDRLATYMLDKHWTEHEKIEIFGVFPLFERVPKTALYEIIASTALSLAHQKFGDLEIYEEQILAAFELLNDFIKDRGIGNVVKLYSLVTSYENEQALHYYGRIPEKIFNLGSWHRPWVDYSLSDELFWGISEGCYQIEIVDQQRYVSLTDQGVDFYFTNMQILEDCGYLIHRVRQMQIQNFSFYTNYAEVANEFWPNLTQIRREFLEWSGIRPEMAVLELGCADGVSTFESGLAELVGAKGRVTAIDPSMGMIYRAKKRKARRPAEWVEFEQASAEELPYADQSFDAVIAFNSLHFMNIPRALADIKRVLRSGGFFASLHPLQFNMAAHPLVAEWFSPIFALAGHRKDGRLKDYLKSAEEITHEFLSAELINISEKNDRVIIYFKDPEMATHHLLCGIGWGQEELSMIPWQAREEVIQKVIDQGRKLCDEYLPEERKIKTPVQMIKGYNAAR